MDSSSYVCGLEAGRPMLCDSSEVAYAPRMATEPADRALMMRYRDGDVAAFEALYRRHKDPLYRYLLRHCRNRAAADDVFQDVWSKIIRARENYRPTARFATWLYRIAYNCFIDHVRRNRRHDPGADVDPDSRAAPDATPEDSAEHGLARRRLDAALAELPDEQRDAFLLREEAGLTVEEIGRVTGVNRETAKSRLRYAMAKLRAALDGAGDNV